VYGITVASALDSFPASKGSRGTRAAAAATVAEPFTKFLLLTFTFSALESVNPFFSIFIFSF
jgi:hypothetical protein